MCLSMCVCVCVCEAGWLMRIAERGSLRSGEISLKSVLIINYWDGRALWGIIISKKLSNLRKQSFLWDSKLDACFVDKLGDV
jgi:hypothetical protein